MCLVFFCSDFMFILMSTVQMYIGLLHRSSPSELLQNIEQPITPKLKVI